MIGKNLFKTLCAALLTVLLVVTSLSGCAGTDNSEKMENGERFEAVITIEGMEETVKYEHVINKTVGFEMDYDYEMLVRRNGANYERFVSQYDDIKTPENYIEIACKTDDADTVAATVSAELSKDFDKVEKESYTLDRAGQCVQITVSDAKAGNANPNLLQTAYIIPTSDGCLVATLHYTFESSEGFLVRFSAIVNTLSIIEK